MVDPREKRMDRTVIYPVGPYRGSLELTMLVDVHGWTQVRIDLSDPKVLISEELFGELQQGKYSPAFPAKLAGGLLTIDGINRSVTYRIGDYVRDLGCYEMNLEDAVPPRYWLTVVPWKAP